MKLKTSFTWYTVFLVALPLVVLVLWMNSAPQDLSGSMSAKIMLAGIVVISCILAGKDIVDGEIDKLVRLKQVEHDTLRDMLQSLVTDSASDEFVFSHIVRRIRKDAAAHRELFVGIAPSVLDHFSSFCAHLIESELQSFAQREKKSGTEIIEHGQEIGELECLRDMLTDLARPPQSTTARDIAHLGALMG